MLVAASCGGGVFQQQELGDWSGLRESWMEQSTEIFSMKTCSTALRTSDWAEGSPSNMTMKHTAKVTQEWLRDISVNPLEWPSQGPDLNPTKHLWRDLKMAVHRRSPSNLTELERICKEEIPQSRCAKLVASYPKRFKAVIAAKGPLTKYWVKGLNTYVNVMFFFFFLINLQTFLKLFSLCHYEVRSVD